MKKSLQVILFLAGICALTIMQSVAQVSVHGRVLNAESESVHGAMVFLRDKSIATVTDEQGNYILKNVPEGDYTLTVRSTGYMLENREIKVGNKPLHLNFFLKTDEKQLQEVVVSGAKKFAEKKSEYVSRMPISNLENAQVYTVVPKELFQEQLSTDLKSALQTVPGLTNITQGVGSGGVGLSIRTRGFSGTNAGGAIRNGMATNFVSLSDPVNLEAIEVIKGPSSTLFGATLVNYGGLVNRVTKKPFNYTKGSIDYSTGSFGLSRIQVDVNAPVSQDKRIMVRLNGAYHNEESFQDYGKTLTRVLAPSVRYEVNDRLTLDLDLEAFSTQRNTTYIGGIATNGSVTAKGLDELAIDFNKSFTTDQFLSDSKIFNAYASATYKISEQWTSHTNYSYANTNNMANYMFLNLTTDSTFSRSLMNIPSTFGINQIQQNFNGDFKIGPFRNRVLVGFDFMELTTTDRRTSVAYDAFNFNDPAPDVSNEKYEQLLATQNRGTNSRNYKTHSAYISEVLNVTDFLIASASIRVDRFNSKFDDYKQTAWSPKFGLVYQVIKNQISLFGNYMNAFQNVSPQLVYGDTEKTAFKPEQANQIEGGVKLELLGGKLNGTLSYYDIKVKDKVRTDPEHPGYSLQDGTQNSKGFEADVIANPVKGLHLIFGYGYNESLMTEADSSVVNLRPTSAPYHTANTWISYKFMDGKVKGLGLGFGGNYQSKSLFVNRRVKTGAYYNEEPFTFAVDGFTRLDATVFYEQEKYRLGLKVNNFTNEKYWTTDSYAFREPNRQFIINLTYKF